MGKIWYDLYVEWIYIFCNSKIVLGDRKYYSRFLDEVVVWGRVDFIDRLVFCLISFVFSYFF